MSTGATDEPVKREATQAPTPGEPATLPDPISKPRKSFFRTRWRQLRNWLEWFFPNGSAVNWSGLSDESAHDAKENDETLVPKDLELRVPAVWGCELYGPGEINDLYMGLRKLGWGSTHRIGDKEGIEKWIRQSRAYGRQGAWLNAGHVVDRGDQNKYVFGCNYAPLPCGVLSLDVEVFQLTPSLTAVSVRFRLDEAIARRYEDEINRERSTYRKRIPRSRSISILGPRNQKHDDVARVRKTLRRLVANWYKQNLPGYFSTNNREMMFPMMELLTVKDGPILHLPPDMPSKTVMGWQWLLNLAFPFLIWTSQENDGIQLVMGDNTRDEDEQGRVITVAVDDSRFSEESMSAYGGKSPDSVIYVCGQELRYILPHATTIEYLREQTRYLNISREQLKEARSGRANLSRTLHAVSQFFDQSLGVPALARELAEKSKKPGWYRLDVEFTAPGWRPNEPPRRLSDEFQSITKFMASRLAEDEVIMRAHFEQLSSILSIHESIKAQRRMQFLTILALVVAVLSLLVAFAGPHTVAEWLNGLWTNCLSLFRKR